MRLGGLVLASWVAAGCAAGPAVPTATPRTGDGPAATAGGSAQAAQPLTVADDGVSLTVVLEPVVAPGGEVHVDALFTNHRATPLVHDIRSCGSPVGLTIQLEAPPEPEGLVWPGIAGQFKRYALARALGPGGTGVEPYRNEVRTACPDEPMERELGPGASIRSTFTWTAELVHGVPAPPGTAAVHVEAAYERIPEAQLRLAGSAGTALRVLSYKTIAVEAAVEVVGPRPPILSAGQAIDVALADPQFAAWLTRQPVGTWSGANLFLQHATGAGGLVPAGPSWTVKLFRENGVPRQWAFAYVDPVTGLLRSVRFCDPPCDR